MFTTSHHEPDLHALARHRAQQLRREAMDHAWGTLTQWLRGRLRLPRL